MTSNTGAISGSYTNTMQAATATRTWFNRHCRIGRRHVSDIRIERRLSHEIH
ncbi:hypothetical protein QCM80_43630 [Bradyrhizobium sp. SSUT112]|nr:hypothetical protein [Bradyrhizobium sp. SSUT112]MDH2357395.1 hypothetical protein [Bradyrhizobium sp. SSUT112]